VDGIASVQEVVDPERFGIAVVDSDGLLKKLVEKPKTKEHRLALTGLYYFAEGRELVKAIKTQIESGTAVNHEYYLADAINILLMDGMRIRAYEVSHWLDAGTPEDLLKVNAWLLRNSHENRNEAERRQSNVLIPPVYIHESARIENSIIGPNVAIGKNCSVNRSLIKNTVIDDDSIVAEVTLVDSLIGRGCCVRGNPRRSIMGDHSRI
jgi:glucose-1-phosphate thymidylyltransferase